MRLARLDARVRPPRLPLPRDASCGALGLEPQLLDDARHALRADCDVTFPELAVDAAIAVGAPVELESL